MRNRWQLKIIFMVLLITSCFGGPVHPPKKNVTLTNKVVVTPQSIKLTSDTPKLKEENPNPTEVVENKAPLNSILNYKVSIQNITEVKNQSVSQAPSSDKNASVVPAVVNPSASPAVEITDPAAGAVEQNKTTIISDSTVIENNESKANESVTTNEANEANMTTKDETKPTAGEVKQENNASDSLVNPTLPSANNFSTVSVDKKVNTSEPESGNNKETDPKLESSVNSQSNGTTQNQEQSMHSESNKLTENQEPSIGSDNNTQIGNPPSSANSDASTQSDNQENSADSNIKIEPDNQQPSADSVITEADNQQPSLIPEGNTQNENKDFSIDSGSNILTSKNDPIESDLPVQASNVASGKSRSSTPSSFNINFGDSVADSVATYEQNSESYYTSFESDKKNEMSSSNDIIEDIPNNEDSLPYDNGEGPYENERGAYENQQQKLSGHFTNDEDSHFFAYFLTIVVTAIVFYLLFHNKQRIIALIIEGRSPRSRRTSRGTRYHKLDNNFEEAMGQTKGSTRFDGLY